MQPCPVRDAVRSVASQNRVLLVAKMDPDQQRTAQPVLGPRVARTRVRCAASGGTMRLRSATLNKTSIKPAAYGERFVKRRRLFCVALASPHGAVTDYVSRQDNDRSAVHQLDQDRSGRRAGRGNASVGPGLADLGPHG